MTLVFGGSDAEAQAAEERARNKAAIILQQAAKADPKDAYARRLARDSKRLTSLDAHQVSSTEDLMVYGECHYFYGQLLDGHACDKKRYKYE